MTVWEQEILVGVAVLVIAAILASVASSIKKAYECLKSGQVNIQSECQNIALSLKTVEGRFDKGDQWMEMHQESDNERFAALQDSHKQLRAAIDRGRRA